MGSRRPKVRLSRNYRQRVKYFLKMLNKKAIVIGLDCLSPQLLFIDFLKDLPTIRGILKNSLWGKMTSTIPPITCPAWASMVTSKDPGSLGIYGFRNRLDYSYDNFSLTTSYSVREKAIWDIIAKKDKKSIVVGVPPSYPPKPINGIMTGCFLTPSEKSNYSYPQGIKDEISKRIGSYNVDVRKFRTNNKDKLLKDIYDLSENRYQVCEYLIKNKNWDFFMFVDLAPDRLHHGFWRYCDPKHKKFRKNNKYKNTIRDYYKYLDLKIKNIISWCPKDTTVYIVSDHGAKRIDGCFCINEWLINQGYLVLKKYPKKISLLSPDAVNWPKTSAWAQGGYYGRIFFNVKGREPQGVIRKKDYLSFCTKLIKELKNIKYIDSEIQNTLVYKPKDIYRKVKQIPPDIMVFFGNLYWRCAGSVGFKDIYTFENDTGPDDANHDYEGIFIMYSEKLKGPRQLKKISIYDFAPTVLNNMGMSVPADMQGKVLTN